MSTLHGLASELEDMAAEIRYQASASEDLARAVKALDGVAALHYDTIRDGRLVCAHCGCRWRCPTAEAMRGVEDML